MAKRTTSTKRNESEFEMEPPAFKDPLQDFFDQFPNSGRKFKIGRYSGTGIEHLVSTPDIVDEDYLQENFGGGRFVIRAFIDGVQKAEHELRIAGAPKGEKPPEPEFRKPEPEVKTNGNGNSNMDFLQQLVLTLAGKESSAPVSSASELASVAKVLSEIGGKGSSEATYMDGFKAGLEMAKDVSGTMSGDWKTDAIRAIKDTLPALAATIGQARGIPTGKTPGTQPQVTVQTQEEIELQNLNRMVYDAIQKLKPYSTMMSPETVIDFILPQASKPEYEPLIRVALNTEFDVFTTIDPTIAQAPYRAWFESFFDGLRSAFTESNDVDDSGTGGDGNAGNPADNANAGGKGVH